MASASKPDHLPPDVDDAVKKAHAVINDLNHCRRRWTLSVPVREDYDPDMVLTNALCAQGSLIEQQAKTIEFLKAQVRLLEHEGKSEVRDEVRYFRAHIEQQAARIRELEGLVRDLAAVYNRQSAHDLPENPALLRQRFVRDLRAALDGDPPPSLGAVMQPKEDDDAT